MGTVDQMTINRQYGEQFDQDSTGAFGRRVYLESPSLGNKEEEDMYRYVPSRLSEHAPSVMETVPLEPRAGPALMDSLDFELDMLGANNARSHVPYRGGTQVFQESKPFAQPTTSYPSISDPRQDPLLGPLLTELDAMTSQQPPVPSVYQRSSGSYGSNLFRPSAQTRSNDVLANRTINDALLDAELYNSLEPPLTRPVRESPSYPQVQQRPTNMNSTDLFLPTSYPYEPTSILSQFGSEDQLFRRPSLHHLGQNYLPNPTTIPRQQQYGEPPGRPRYPSDNQNTFYADYTNSKQPEPNSYQASPMAHQQEDDSKRQAVWNDLQRTNQQKRDSANRTKPTPPSSNQHQYRPSMGTKVPHLDNDMSRNKENSYQRSPTKRPDVDHYSNQERQEIEVQIPIQNNDQTPRTVAVPINSQVNRVGDKISLNIDLQLVDAQNMNEGSADQPHWSGLDPLNQHIRKLERNMDRSLPAMNPPQRSPPIPNTGMYGSSGRQGRTVTGPIRAGYSPPSYSGHSSEKTVDDDSYLAKLNYARKYPQFKPYTGRDYEQFKKNYGFGIGRLAGNEYDSTTSKEKSEKLAKTREYAQQVEARNKKKLLNSPQRTLSDTRLPNKHSPSQRVTDSYM